MSFSRRVEGLAGDPPKIMCTTPSSSGYTAPRAVVVVEGWPSLLGLIRRSWIEGVVDVVLDEPTILERVPDGDLVVRARCIQEPLEVVLGRRGLGRVALGT
jgi:hypothetical protein